LPPETVRNGRVERDCICLEPEAGHRNSISRERGDGRFALATEPREFSFPADHGSHDEFRNEWWYFTGNLADTSVDILVSS